jgi:hypothetical protein
MKHVSHRANLMTTIVACAACSGCPSGAHIDKPPAIVHSTTYLVDQVGRLSIDSKCAANEQLVGGGYRVPPFHVVTTHFKKEEDRSPQEIFDGTNLFTDDATDADKHQAPLIVEGSYPSSLDTWTLVVYNPDFDNQGYHHGDLIQVESYCVTNPSLKLRMAISSIAPHPTQPPDQTDPSTGIISIDNIDAPPGAVVTSGGFKLEPLVSDDKWKSSAFVGPLWGSYPKTDTGDHAVGWSSEYDTYAFHNAKITTYLMYSPARRILIPNGYGPNATVTLGALVAGPLVAGQVKKDQLQVTNGVGPRPGDLAADPGYFTPGGGFRSQSTGQDALSLLLPHGDAIRSAADPLINGVRVPLGGWSTEPFGAHNPGYYNWPTQEAEFVYALQIANLPRNIEVEIVNPPDGANLTEDPAHPGFASVTLKGYAIDHDGSDITGDSLVWKISDVEVGKGPTIDVQVDLNAGAFSEYLNAHMHPIWLQATGKQGDHETAYIDVYTRTTVIVP